MKWLYIVAMLAIVTAGCFVLIKFGWEPSPVGVMKPSFFDEPEQVGAVVYRRFYSPIEQYKLIVVGVPPQPEWQRRIPRGVLQAAVVEGAPFDVVIAEPQMPELDVSGIPNLVVEKMSINSQTQSEFIDRIRVLKQAGKKVLVYTASVFSTHILAGNAINRYEKATGERLFAVTSGPLSLAATQEHIVDPACVGSQRDSLGTSELGCAMLRTSRGFYRKRLKQDRFVAVMNSPKPEDYLLLVSAPGQDKIEPKQPELGK